MERSIKQIYVSLEISENDLKILVAEYFNTRFNVIKVLKKDTKCINDFKVSDKAGLKKDLKELIDECSKSINTKIENVILVLPAYNFKRIPLKSKVIPEKGYVTKNDIARSISNALRTKVDYDIMTINAMPTKYTINDISTRRIPENEHCDEMIVDIDLLCADKNMTYDYVSVVEECGVKVLDIVLNSYAIGKEASLFEESLKKNIICLDIQKSLTFLTLFSKGKIVSNEIVFDGLNTIISDMKVNFDIPNDDLLKLIKYDINTESNYLDDIIYAYSSAGNTKTITTRQLNDICIKLVERVVDNLVGMCAPIIEQGASLFITGEGQQMKYLVDRIKDKANCEVNCYYPETIGVRDSSLTALFGSLVAYNEKAKLNDLNVTCIDLLKYDENIDQKEIDSEGETITTKIKNLFKQYVDREEE